MKKIIALSLIVVATISCNSVKDMINNTLTIQICHYQQEVQSDMKQLFKFIVKLLLELMAEKRVVVVDVTKKKLK